MTQLEALDTLKSGSNVFLTGSAGSGKTFVLQKYLLYLKQQRIKVGVTASTGIAATQLEGMTIHAWSGIGVKSELSGSLLRELLTRKYLYQRFDQTKVLIIDEISMLSRQTFEVIDQVCQAFKQNSLPFGGMQVVLCGDFFQLPPVTPATTGGEAPSAEFIFSSPSWDALDLKVCYLDKPYRQQTDERFIRLLSEIRENNVTEYTWETLKERFLNPITIGMTPTRLFTHNSQADQINSQELAKLKGEERVFDMTTRGNAWLIDVMKKNTFIPERLVLKERTLVMFIKNAVDGKYANGTLGRVVDFQSQGYPIVETFDGRQIRVSPTEWTIEDDPSTGSGQVEASVTQLPLRLAWAITIHKSQGMSLDAAEIDLGKSFVKGMGYVALSRVRTLTGLRLRSINPMALRVNEEVLEFDQELQLASVQTVTQLRDLTWQQQLL